MSEIKDSVETDPDKYKVIFENERVRVLEYRDKPGDTTNLHHHPDSVMYFLSSFKRKIAANGKSVLVDGKEGSATWLSEQSHLGENIGDTETHVILVELKEKGTDNEKGEPVLGPEAN